MNHTLMLHQIGKDPLYKIWHTSSRALFMYVYAGSGSVVTKDRSYPIEERALILIAPGTYHYTMPEDPDSYDRSKFILSSSACRALLELLHSCEVLPAHSEPSVIYARIPPELHETIDRIFSGITLCNGNGADTPLLLSYGLQLLFYLNRYATRSATPAGFMSDAIRYINEHISAPMDLDGICSAIGISKYYFCRQFKLQLGMTVMEYILNTRLVLAKDELEKTDLPISRISEKYGFSSVSYFCQAFKAENGDTPLQYRKKKRHLGNPDPSC